LPAQVKLRERVFATLRRSFELSGFEPIDTPAFERLETLTGKYGEEGDKLIFKILRRGEQGKSGEVDLALRYDLTVPMARFYARNRQELSSPFKRYQIGPVWRADRPGRGRFREFYQCDVDIIGSDSELAEVEILATLAHAYKAAGLPGCVFQVNSRRVLDALLEVYGVPAEHRGGTTVALDKLDKIGVDGVMDELSERGLPAEARSRIRADLEASEVQSVVRERVAALEHGQAGLANLDDICALAGPLMPAGTTIAFSPFLARGLDYYTGMVFEVFHKDLPIAIGSGGRYDNLIENLAGVSAPACGGSVGVERVIMLLEAEERRAPAASCDVMVTVWNRDGRADALQVTSMLREHGLRAEVFLGTGKLAKQLKRAGKQAIPCVVMRGPDEVAAGRATVKFLAGGEQATVDLDQLATVIKDRLSAG
jgi:histidyl-tRNA synthetase